MATPLPQWTDRQTLLGRALADALQELEQE
jgi:hypothetical protein